MPVEIRVPMCDFVIFGGTGDLAVRKLLPALYRCDRDGRLPDETRVIAAARAGLDDAGYPPDSSDTTHGRATWRGGTLTI